MHTVEGRLQCSVNVNIKMNNMYILPSEFILSSLASLFSIFSLSSTLSLFDDVYAYHMSV